MSGVELFVYRDKEYPSAWINDKVGYPDRISSFLESRGFKRIDANQLRDFMINAIDGNDAHRKLIIFSQDIVPDTIAEDYYSNTTFREYLDTGGNALWIGDIPLFYIGNKDRKLDEAWKKGAPLYMLGIVPIFSETPKQAVTFTWEGKMFGLKRHWSGRRPIMADSGIRVLAKSECIFSSYYINVPERPSFWKKFTSKVKRVRVEAEPASFEIEFHPPPTEVKTTEVKTTFHQSQINAWIKNYNETHPDSGFFRIWDYGPKSMNNSMLEELYNVASTILKRI